MQLRFLLLTIFHAVAGFARATARGTGREEVTVESSEAIEAVISALSDGVLTEAEFDHAWAELGDLVRLGARNAGVLEA